MWRPLAAVLLARSILALAGAAAIAAPAEARMHSPYRGHRIVPGTSAPLDSFATPAGAYSFRKLKSNYAGAAIRIRRASDNLETDINFLGCTGFTGCPWDEAAASSHCSATSCFVRTWYDQSGNARDLVNATPATQPALVFSCQGGLPCMRGTATETLASAGTITPATGLVSFSVVAQRSGSTGSCAYIRENASNRLNAWAANANQWIVLGGAAGSITAAASDGVFHAGQGVVNVAASVFRIDATETTGSTTGNVTAGAASILGVAGTTCQWGESIFWDNYALTAGERTALAGNQKSFWGTP